MRKLIVFSFLLILSLMTASPAMAADKESTKAPMPTTPTTEVAPPVVATPVTTPPTTVAPVKAPVTVPPTTVAPKPAPVEENKSTSTNTNPTPVASGPARPVAPVLAPAPALAPALAPAWVAEPVLNPAPAPVPVAEPAQGPVGIPVGEPVVNPTPFPLPEKVLEPVYTETPGQKAGINYVDLFNAVLIGIALLMTIIKRQQIIGDAKSFGRYIRTGVYNLKLNIQASRMELAPVLVTVRAKRKY